MGRRAKQASAVLALWMALGSVAQAKLVPGYSYAPGEVIVKFRDRTTAVTKNDIMATVGGSQVQVFPGIGASHWRVATTVAKAVAALESDPRLLYAEPNYVIHQLGVPNDPRFSEQWGVNNTGQTGGLAGADVDLPEAWNITTGSSSVIVAVLDTGVDYNHPDLAPNIWQNPGEIPGNGVDDDGNGYVDDVRGWDFGDNDADPMDFVSHGTFIAGIVGAAGNDGVGVSGVNWNVSVMPLKLFSSAADTANMSMAISAIEYAIAQGVDVMSNSWGGGPYDPALVAAITNAYNADIYFVCAVGNVGNNNDVIPFYPSGYTVPNVVAVLATDHNDEPVSTANWGWMTSYGATSVDIGAPGQLVLSTIPNNGYLASNGTSFSTPFVAGAFALLRSRFPAISVDAGVNRLLTVGYDPLPGLVGKCVTGGRLNVFKLIADPDTIPPAGVVDLVAGAVGSDWVDLTWTAPGDDLALGTATSYELRWSLSPIVDEATWSVALPVAGVPVPLVGGTLQGSRAEGLPPASSVHLSLRAVDERGNFGPVSADAMATTLPPPVIGVTPGSLSATVPSGGATTGLVTISNNGPGILDFTIPAVEFPPTFAKSGAGIERAGGPDTFGYLWRDSDAVGGPAFNWIAIDSGGTHVPMAQWANSSFFPVGFYFDYSGISHDLFTVST